MLSILCDAYPSNVPDRFRNLINRFLPAGSVFTIAPVPRTVITQPSDRFAFYQNVSITRVPGDGLLQYSPSAPAGTPQWKINFRDELNRILSDFIEVTIAENPPGVLVGQFAGIAVAATIDVQDLERLPDEAAAGAIIHELEEQRRRQVARQNFDNAHAGAASAESRVLGGTRRTADELSSAENRDRAASWQWWIPIEMPRGFIRALVVRGSFLNITSSNFIGDLFPNIGAFREAFNRRPAP